MLAHVFIACIVLFWLAVACIFVSLLPVGTRSILYGAHCFFIHPFFVFRAWWKMYGFPRQWQLYACFLLHDVGYWGLPNTDGPEGEKHVLRGAWLVHRLCDRRRGGSHHPMYWHDVCINHSRYWAKQHNHRPSRLCYADKYAMLITPRWLYLPMVYLTGEWREYAAAHAHETGIDAGKIDIRTWYAITRNYMRAWYDAHKEGADDTWTKAKVGSNSIRPQPSASRPQ